MLILLIIIILLLIFFIIRYISYINLLKFESIENFNGKTNLSLDKIYYDYLKFNDKEPHILNDYSKIDLVDVEDSYNIVYIRKFPWSHPTDSTIELADIKDNMHILDAGCGTGMVSVYICNKFKNLKSTCIVNTQKLFNIVTKNIKKYNLSDRMFVYLMDFDNLQKPIIDYKFDRIIFLESIDYSKNRLKLINNCYNMLKKDGKLFIKSPQFINEPSNYEDIRRLVYKWGYNFSNISSIINDFKNTSFTDVKYKSARSYNFLVYYNPTDLVKIIKFIIKNKLMLFLEKEDYNYFMEGSTTFIIATKTMVL